TTLPADFLPAPAITSQAVDAQLLPAQNSSDLTATDQQAPWWILGAAALPEAAWIAAQLKHAGERVIHIHSSTAFAKQDDGTYELNPDEPADWQQLFQHLRAETTHGTSEAELPPIKCRGMISLWGLELPAISGGEIDWQQLVQAGT